MKLKDVKFKKGIVKNLTAFKVFEDDPRIVIVEDYLLTTSETPFVKGIDIYPIIRVEKGYYDLAIVLGTRKNTVSYQIIKRLADHLDYLVFILAPEKNQPIFL